jgi:hypothetical protein
MSLPGSQLEQQLFRVKVLELIQERIQEIDVHLEEYKTTSHEYPLLAAKYELTQLGLKLLGLTLPIDFSQV